MGDDGGDGAELLDLLVLFVREGAWRVEEERAIVDADDGGAGPEGDDTTDTKRVFKAPHAISVLNK